jgi:hypothetical protein
MKKLLIPLVCVGLAVGCGDVPTGTDGPTPNFGVAGNSGCYTVSGVLGGILGSPFTISGDVEGTITIVISPPVHVGGVVWSRYGQQTWEITGGIVTPLIGKTVVWEYEFLSIWPIGQFPVGTTKSTARLVEGAQRGSFTAHGTYNYFTAQARQEYHGVICP